jgi:hypothetical protein
LKAITTEAWGLMSFRRAAATSKLEYLYVDLGTVNGSLCGTCPR